MRAADYVLLQGALFVTIILSQLTVFAQTTPAPAPAPFDYKVWNNQYTEKTTLGGYLERFYTEVLDDCKLAPLSLLKKGKDSPTKPISSIPLYIQRNLPLNKQIWAQDDRTLAATLAFIFPKENKQSPEGFDFNSERLLFSEELNADPGDLIQLWKSRLIASHNCSGIVSAAGNLKGEYSLPMASFQAALNAEYSNKKQLLLSLARGEFTSPFANLLFPTTDTTVVSPERLSALMTLWNWYLNQFTKGVDESKFDNYIIKKFNGVAVFELTEQRSEEGGKLSASASASVPIFFSANAKAGVEFKGQNLFEIRTFSTAAYRKDDNKADVEMAIVPKPKDITDAVSKSFRGTLPDNYQVMINPDAPAFTTQVVKGIPDRLCNKDYWDVEPSKNVKGTLTLDGARSLNETPKMVGVCSFTVKYVPTPNDFKESQVVVDFNFTTKPATSLGELSLKIPASTVTYNTSRSPELYPLEETPYASAEAVGNNKVLSWEVSIIIADDRGLVDWSRDISLPNSLYISCDKEKPVNLDPKIERLKAEHKIKISFSKKLSSNLDFDQPSTCDLVGTLGFARLNPQPGESAIILRKLDQFDVKVKYPKAKSN
jgi:hypothetical protein